MEKREIVLSIAGSDSGAGAGIQADIKSVAAVGGYCATAITAITAQNTQGVEAIFPLSPEAVEAQIEAVVRDMSVKVIKSGMLPSRDIIEVVCSAIKRHKIPYVVVDPVMVATSGDRLSDDSSAKYMVDHLFPLATIITPNIPEAEAICNLSLKSPKDFRAAASILKEFGAEYALIKGGHSGKKMICDYLYNLSNIEEHRIRHSFTPTENTHGTGCSLSSAIAGYISLGYSVEESVTRAITYISKAIKGGAQWKIGSGHSPIKHL